jgi:DNA-binding NarL/FixJ family response regulator
LASPLIRLVIVEDHAIVLHGLAGLFQRHPDMRVIACCTRGSDALAVLRREQADVVILDLRMRDMSGLDVLRAMRAEGLTCPVVVLTAAVSDTDALETMRLGARGLVLKERSPEELVECVRKVARGEQWFEPQTMSRALNHVLSRDTATDGTRVLTARELEIVRLIASGHRNRAVASRLSISEGTVKIHLHNIYEKLDVDGRLELAVWAQSHGLSGTEPPA